MDLITELKELESNAFFLRNEVRGKTITKLSAEKRMALAKKIEQASILISEALLITGRENMFGNEYDDYHKIEDEIAEFEDFYKNPVMG